MALEQCMADLLTAEDRIASLEEDNRILSDGWRVAIHALHDEKRENLRLRRSNQRITDEFRTLREQVIHRNDLPSRAA